MFWARIKQFGQRLDGKQGITGELLGWFTDEQIAKQRANAAARGGYIVVEKIEPECLDGLFEDDLDKEAVRQDMPKAYRQCAKYMAAAMRARYNGDMVTAERWQANCEKAYADLPEEWRW